MSFKRKQYQKQKTNNLVAKHDFNRGGYHNDNKSKRISKKIKGEPVNQININDYEDMFND